MPGAGSRFRDAMDEYEDEDEDEGKGIGTRSTAGRKVLTFLQMKCISVDFLNS